ncbi:GNAT family N-acetyltransferase [Nocardia sp. NPDC024068]|uniref:GNAT family N-acetyltransferase n=1 Tax=Nocardia sp. NPDC024068 TaxID=3157197 RepID=UPI0033F8DED8
MWPIGIRPRTSEDLPACVNALRQAHEADGYPAVWPDAPAHWLNPAKMVDSRVADDGSSVVGHVGIGESMLPPAVGAAVHDRIALISVIRLFVVLASRRQGTGRALLDAAATMAALRGCRAVLDVEDGAVAAVSLYERAGWQRIHSGPGTWTMPDGRAAYLHHYLSP